MRVALCQINPTVGDLAGNAARIADAARRASKGGAHLAVLPELALSGYPPQDLLQRRGFMEDVARTLTSLAENLPEALHVMVGFPELSPHRPGALHNSAAYIHGGTVRVTVRKRLLPTYDVFDEDRHFEPGDIAEPIEIEGQKVGVTICEDIWNDVPNPVLRARYEVNPVAEQLARGAEILVNLSASPFTLEKRVARAQMVSTIAKTHGVPVIYVNQVGGNDDLLFDGASSVHGREGQLLARAASFREDLLSVDLASGEPMAGHHTDLPAAEEATIEALVMGIADYARKCGFRRALLGLSGGIDSALVAALAAQALGPDNVVGLAMPTRYSSAGSVTDAQALAQALGIGFRVIDIDPIFETFLQTLREPLDAFGPTFEGDVTLENIQARIRCATLMAHSNRNGSLLLTTGNKSEIAVGYCTLYGDMAGGLAVISDLPKTFVYRVARAMNRMAGRDLIPEGTLTKAPSAELRPNQTDQDSLPPYEILDGILERLIEGAESTDDIVRAGFDRTTVEEIVRLVRRNEYKRRQMPPGLIVTRKAFGPGRRYPIAQRYLG
ncbi:MAG: NAD+ synthase [Myxococcales bacterium]|nr:NAD+ synthase [Myxococcales bacterium]